MENSCHELIPHPHLLEVLFAFKSKISSVFKDVLGLHEINHVAITRVNTKNELLTLSSTPAMEFNLFSGALWRYDRAYDPRWFRLCTQDYWPNLYQQSRYDELYYLKQIKHALPLGLSLAAQMDNHFVIYSIASHKSCPTTRELFIHQQEDFYKIGHYCFNILNPLFTHCDASSSQAVSA